MLPTWGFRPEVASMECKWFLSQRLEIPWDTILIFFDKNRRDNDRKKRGGSMVHIS